MRREHVCTLALDWRDKTLGFRSQAKKNCAMFFLIWAHFGQNGRQTGRRHRIRGRLTLKYFALFKSKLSNWFQLS